MNERVALSKKHAITRFFRADVASTVEEGRKIHANQRKMVGAPEQYGEKTDRCVPWSDCFSDYVQQTNKYSIFDPRVNREWIESSFTDYSVVR